MRHMKDNLHYLLFVIYFGALIFSGYFRVNFLLAFITFLAIYSILVIYIKEYFAKKAYARVRRK